MPDERIGDFNGWKAAAFKMGLAFTPWILGLIVSLNVYMISELQHIRQWMAATEANRFTMTDWVEQREKLINQLPPRWVHEALAELKERTARNERAIQELEHRERASGR